MAELRILKGIQIDAIRRLDALSIEACISPTTSPPRGEGIQPATGKSGYQQHTISERINNPNASTQR